MGYIAGLFGIAAGVFIHLCYLLSSYSFGVPIFLYNSLGNYRIKPIWKYEHRFKILNTKKPESAPEISMTWRDGGKK